ncbi:MAG: hypothetical protein U9N10_00235 [Bacillota bacterium]|nr:hypothetical protein [Bacillota bacterium]
MRLEELKGIVILIGIILGAVFITCSIAYALYKKYDKKSFIIYSVPGIMTSVIIAFTLIPYGLSYPDPVGSGLTMMLAVVLMIISNVVGFAFGNYLRK